MEKSTLASSTAQDPNTEPPLPEYTATAGPSTLPTQLPSTTAQDPNTEHSLPGYTATAGPSTIPTQQTIANPAAPPQYAEAASSTSPVTHNFHRRNLWSSKVFVQSAGVDRYCFAAGKDARVWIHAGASTDNPPLGYLTFPASHNAFRLYFGAGERGKAGPGGMDENGFAFSDVKARVGYPHPGSFSFKGSTSGRVKEYEWVNRDPSHDVAPVHYDLSVSGVTGAEHLATLTVGRKGKGKTSLRWRKAPENELEQAFLILSAIGVITRLTAGRYGMKCCCLIFITLFWHLSACVAQELSPPQEAVFQPRYDQALDKGSRGSYPVREFYSTKTKIPNVNFLKWTPECATRNDFYFITPKGWKVPNPGPMILDHRGDLVWFEHFDNEFGGNAYDLMVQEYLGEKFLTFWLGDDRVRGHGAGHFHMINPAYDTIHQIGAGNNRSADLHEFRLTPQGTALIIVFEPIPFDVRPAGRVYGGLWDQYMWDCLIQEVDIKTKDAIFEWRASDHIDIKDSYNTIVDRSEGTPGNPYDAFHFNSVDKDELGNYLVSARYTHAIYYISGTTNQIIWTLGGKNNTFMDISPVSPLNFAWQHDARFVDVNAFPETYVPPPAKEGSTTRLLSLFDNAAEDWNYNQGPSNARGLLLEITYPTTPPAKEHAPKPVRNRDETDRMFKESQKSTTMSGTDAYKVADINGTDPAYTVRLVQQYTDAHTWRASSQGSMQLVPTETGKDPHVLLGHGINAVIAEYSGNGTLLCDMHFGAQSGWEKGDVQSYRALKFSDWVGRPHVPPDIAVVGHHAYVSWNGATGVDQWLLQTWEGGEGDHWVAAGLTKKTGFETKLEIPSDKRKSKFLRVTAIDANGQACEHGVSDALERGYMYGRKKRSGMLTWRQTLLYSVAGFLGFVVSIRLLRRCYARYQRRRGAKWRLT